jgi:hypothetical protein
MAMNNVIANARKLMAPFITSSLLRHSFEEHLTIFYVFSAEENDIHQHSQDCQKHKQDSLPDRVAYHHCSTMHHPHRACSACQEQVQYEKHHEHDNDPNANPG